MATDGHEPRRAEASRGRWLLLAGIVLAVVVPGTAFACSPPFEEPTIRALGPEQVVVVGTIGERILGGRLFHVQRWFNGGAPVSPIVIAFKEGEAVGDCSYPVTTGATLIIAPYKDGAGALSASLDTLQADPTSEVGRRYVAEAIELFGPGFVPQPAVAPTNSGPTPDISALVAGIVLAVALTFVVVVVLAHRQRRRVARGTPQSGDL
ncbi:MAG: hypothetical protein H0V74_09895 [Chloroflexi bacterium]|nr:hypothetical protein [Chloroflexota bacterium]